MLYSIRRGAGSPILRAMASLVLSFFIAQTAMADDTRPKADFDGKQLTILTWSEYIDENIVKDFEKHYNAKINFSYYESDQARTEILATTNGQGYDLILVSNNDLESYVRRGWLEPIDRVDIPNRAHIDPRWAADFETGAKYGVPYFWGTLGIAYRRDLVPAPITSWAQLLDPPEELQGRIIMNKDVRELVAIAMLAMGQPVNSSDRDYLRKARTMLQKQATSVKKYSYVSLTENSALVKGDAWVSMIYNGDVLMLSEHSDEIAYAQPTEGSTLWVDYFTITATSANKDLAAAFINYINEPNVAARNADYVYYATPNLAAKSQASEEYLNNPIIFPPKEQLAEMTFLQQLNPRATKFTNSLMAMLLNLRQASR